MLLSFAQPAAAQPKVKPPAPPSRPELCDALLEPAGFENRYEMIGGMTRITACAMRELIAEEEFEQQVRPRLQAYLASCYSSDERPYLRRVVRRGVIQAMPYASEAGCESMLEKVLRIDLSTLAPAEKPDAE